MLLMHVVIVGGALLGVLSHTELLSFSGGCLVKATVTLEAPVGCSKTLGGRLS